MAQISTLALMMGGVAGQVLFGDGGGGATFDTYSDGVVLKAHYELPVDSGPDSQVLTVRGPIASSTTARFGDRSLYNPHTYNATEEGCIQASDSIPLTDENFTIEFFSKFDPTNKLVGGDVLVGCSTNTSGSYGWYLSYDATNKRLTVDVSTDGTTLVENIATFHFATFTDPLENDGVDLDEVFDGNWHHIAIVRETTKIYIYVDGIQGGTVSSDGALASAYSINSPVTCRVRLMAMGNTSSDALRSAQYAYMDAFRMTVGVARYTGAFTPPSSEYPTGGSDANWASVKLLCNFNNHFGITNTGIRDTDLVIDEVRSAGTLPTIDADGLVCGTNYSAVYPTHDPWSPFADDFTIEAWGVRPDTTMAGLNVIAGNYAARNGGRTLAIAIHAASNTWGLVYCEEGTDTGLVASSGESLTSGTAYDLAVERDGSNLKLYQDGVLVNTVAVSVTFKRNTFLFEFNTGTETGDYDDRVFTGRIKAVRYTKGYARYTLGSLVAAPTLPLPDIEQPAAPTSGSHKHWRLSIIEHTSGRDEIDELEFRTTAGTAETPSGGYPAANSAYGHSQRPDRAFDGSTATGPWLANRPATQEPLNTIGYTFASARNVVEVMITAETGNEAPREFDVQFSDNGKTWETKWSVTTGTWTDGQTKVFTAP